VPAEHEAPRRQAVRLQLGQDEAARRDDAFFAALAVDQDERLAGGVVDILAPQVGDLAGS